MTLRLTGIPSYAILLCGFLTFGLVGWPSRSLADQILVAVAANFADCLEAMAPAFEDSTGHHLVIMRGSTGRHYAQIKSGAPFDVFLAADTLRPILLEKEGLTALGTRFTYAEGRLALWLPKADLDDHRTPREILTKGTFNHLAIANPRLAPYGLAAQQVLESMGLWEELQPRLVTGKSVGQAWQFLASGNAEAGFVAIPQIMASPSMKGRWWKLDPPLHEPILQQGVVLYDTACPTAAGQLMDFLRGPHARMIMIRFGYLIPEN
jgi:molybdate transport system substrate-binding protein